MCDFAPGSVTVTSRDPGLAPALTRRFTVISVDVMFVTVTVMPLPKLTVEFARKFAPLILRPVVDSPGFSTFVPVRLETTGAFSTSTVRPGLTMRSPCAFVSSAVIDVSP